MASNTKQGTALITGASSAIGAIYAHRLAKRGYDLVLAAPDTVRLRRIAEWLRKATDASVEILSADPTDETGLALVEQRVASDPSLTMLVNNSSAGATATRALPGLRHVASLIALNVGVPARLAYAAAGPFASRSHGTIVTIAPVTSFGPAALPGTEDGGRALLSDLMGALAAEAHGRGVRIQMVLPDASASAFWDLAGEGPDVLATELLLIAEEMVDQALTDLDQGVVFATPSAPLIGDWSRFEKRAARAALAPFARGALVDLA